MTGPTGFEDLFPKNGSDFGDLFPSGSNPVADRERQRLAASGQRILDIRAKLKAGQTLTSEEANLLKQEDSYLKMWTNVGIALQPFQGLSDVTKGFIGQIQGKPDAFIRGLKAAQAHGTYGAVENLPWFAGARANGVTGEELLKGTKYEGNRDAALAVEIFADPSILLLGAGAAVKGASTAGRLAQLEKLAKTPEGATMIRDALLTANKRGEQIIRLSDEVTGVPAAIRAAPNLPGVGKVVTAVKTAAQKIGDIQVGGGKWGDALRREGGATVADAYLTTDQKRALYGDDPTRQAQEDFRTDVATNESNLRVNIGETAVSDAQVMQGAMKGLSKADAQEVNRLLGRILTTTDPKTAAEVFRKLTVIATRTGKDLEGPFVAAVKAADRTGNAVLGPALKARDLPAVVNPEVTKAIQEAQSGADLIPLIGQYGTEGGRPRGILMTSYKGRENPAQVVDDLAGAEIPAVAEVRPDQLARTLEASPLTDPLPPRPVEPVGIAAAGELPRNAPTLAERITQTPVSETAPFTTGAAKAPTDLKSPADVLDELFTTPTPKASELTPTATPQNVLNDLLSGKVEAAPAAPTVIPERQYMDWAHGHIKEVGELTPEQFEAIFRYTNDGEYTTLNKYLRGEEDGVLLDGKPAQYLADQLDGALARAALKEDTMVYRGLYTTDPVTLQLRDAFQRGELTPGTVFPQKAYSSTSVSEEIARRQFATPGGVVFDVTLPKGSKALPMGGMGTAGEAEVLLARNTDLVVTGAAEKGGILHIQATLKDAPGAGQAARQSPLADMVDKAMSSPVTLKTPKSVLDELLTPNTREADTFLPAAAIQRTQQGDMKGVALPSPEAAPRMVEKTVQNTYRTVEIDANALDWNALPDNSARTAVLNAMGAKNATLRPDASGTLRLNQSNLTAPLNHPTIQRYFSNDELMSAQRQGTSLSEKAVKSRELVPEWYNPRDPAPMDAQRAMHEQAQREAVEQAFPNDLKWVNDQHEIMGDDSWLLGDVFSSWHRILKPDNWNTRAASNAYAARVEKIMGRPPTKGEVARYRMALSRYRQAVNTRNLKPDEVAAHLSDFYRLNPEATAYDGIINTARAFNLGSEGKRYLTGILKQADSGFTRQMSSMEKREFAQMLIAKDTGMRAGSNLTSRLLRKPQEVSTEFKQVFEQDINALGVFEEQVRTRTAAIVRAEGFQRYRGFLEDSGQIITKKDLDALQRTPVSRLTPDQLELRNRASKAVQNPGSKSGWVVMDKNVEGYFTKGDVIPFWAYADLFIAGKVDDAAVSAMTLSRVYDRAFAAMNARLLGSFSSIVNDQIGQMLQLGMWGITPDAMLEGVIRRATASPDELRMMRESGLSGATLEHNIGADLNQLRDIARRVEGDTDMTRAARTVDAVLRFAERSSGINPQAMTGGWGVAADVAGLGSGYVFRARSKMSDLQRESLYFHRRQLGDTPAQAAKYANEVFLDFRMIPAYAKVLKRFIPFWSWTAMSAPRSVLMVLRKPQINAAYQRATAASDQGDDPQAEARRLLMPGKMPFGGAGWINTGLDERNGTRVYLDPNNWDPTNTIPQLLDWSGTKLGSVDLPWYVNLILTVQGGNDRFGRNIYDPILAGGKGGFAEAYAIDPEKTVKLAAKHMFQQFQPSYAPGSPRAKAWVRSVLAAADLPQDGSRDIAIAHTLTSTEAGRAYLLWMQSGAFAKWDEDTLMGTRESQYTDAAPSMARATAGFFLPVKGINADQGVQGTAMQKLSVGQLELSNWVSAQRKRLAEMEAGGASPERVEAEMDRMTLEYDRRLAKLDYLMQVTR